MKSIILFVTGAFLFAICSCKQHIDLKVEKTKVKAVLDKLIEASETEDMELLSGIYAHDPDMVIIGTDAGERLVGWDKLKEVMEKQFAGTESSKMTVKDQVIKVHNSGQAAWFSEIIDWEIIFNGQTAAMEGLRTSGVLENRNGKWVIVQLHYSVPHEQ